MARTNEALAGSGASFDLYSMSPVADSTPDTAETSSGVSQWIVTRSGVGRFPFRIVITRGGRPVFAVRAQSNWPGPGQQIFCLRDGSPERGEPGDELERVPVVAVTRIGRKLAVVLDRPLRKRAEFLTVSKTRADGTPFEQVFFRTESGIRAHRSRARVELLGRADTEGTVLIDTGERYPWSFAGKTALRRRLAVGDYALLRDDRIVAVVERKSFDNLLADLGAIQALHQVCADLAGAPHGALVVEAEYGDFLDPQRLAGRWPPAHLGRVLAELAALHPDLPIIYAGNRKLANAWTAQFFEAVDRAASAAADPQLPLVTEPPTEAYGSARRPESVDDSIRGAALAMGWAFAAGELDARFPEIGTVRIRRILRQLAEEGRLAKSGRGRGVRWTVVGRQPSGPP